MPTTQAYLKIAFGQLYNGKLALRYGHALTDECPLCHLLDSCTHITGERKALKNLTISHHNAACQLVHMTIRNSAKGGGRPAESGYFCTVQYIGELGLGICGVVKWGWESGGLDGEDIYFGLRETREREDR